MQKNKVYYLRIDSILFIILLLYPHYKPLYFEVIPEIDTLFNILRVISAVIILNLYLLKYLRNNYFRKNQTIFLLILCFYYGEILFSTLYNGVNPYDIILRMVSQLSIFLLCVYYSSTNISNLIQAFFILAAQERT